MLGANLSNTAAIEAAAECIRVNTVYPGITETPMMALFPEELRDPVRAFNPVRHFGSQEVAGVIGWLASEHRSHIVGAAVSVDGGQIVQPGSHMFGLV